MKYLKQYRIQFSGLKNGSHDFDFEIDKRFFDEYEYSLVKQGKLKVHVQLEKSDTMLILTFLIEGTVELDCDLCLNEYPENLIINERLFVKFDSDESIADASEEIIVLSKNDYEIDISTLLYEYINSSLPINNRCEDPGKLSFCDAEMINKIESFQEQAEEENKTDPRWDILKNIKNN